MAVIREIVDGEAVERVVDDGRLDRVPVRPVPAHLHAKPAEMADRIRRVLGTGRAVVASDGRRFGDVRTAARAVGRSMDALVRVIENGCRIGGALWRWADAPQARRDRSYLMRRVYCVETGHEYPSIRHAAQAVGRSPNTISNALRTGLRAGAYHWAYVGEPPVTPPPAGRARRERVGSRPVRIDGIEYRSATAASIAVGFSTRTILKAMQRGRLPDGRLCRPCPERRDRPRGPRRREGVAA